MRLATPADAALLAGLGALSFSAAFAAQNDPANMAAYLASAFSPEKQAQELLEPGSLFLIAAVEAQAVGYVRIKQGPAPACVQANNPLEVVRLYAHPDWIGHGVGPRLIQACLDEAVQRGCDVVWLSTWQLNPRGLAFYKKWGFEIVGETSFMLGDEQQHDFILQRRSA